MQTHHIPFITKWECSSGTAIIDAVRHNHGLGVLSERCITAYVKNGEIFSVPVDEVSMKRFFYLCRNQNHPLTSQMQNFIEIAENMA